MAATLGGATRVAVTHPNSGREAQKAATGSQGWPGGLASASWVGARVDGRVRAGRSALGEYRRVGVGVGFDVDGVGAQGLRDAGFAVDDA